MKALWSACAVLLRLYCLAMPQATKGALRSRVEKKVSVPLALAALALPLIVTLGARLAK
jgi:hypothetical protein